MIKVNTQSDFDNIPLDNTEEVYIYGKNIIIHPRNFYIIAWEKSSVVAWGNSSVEARGNSSVEAWGNSSVEAWEKSSVVAEGNSSVVARGNSSVVAWGNSSVEAWEKSSVVAWGNSSVEAWEKSSVVAWGNSSVVAWGNSSVEAWENSSVEAWGNVQIVKCGDGKLTINGNARIVENPHDLKTYLDFYGIEQKDGNAILYKSVKPNLDSFYTDDVNYAIGKTIKCDCDPSTKIECGKGLHVAHKDWALRFGTEHKDFKLIEVSVPLDKIVVPENTDGKVRTSELTVIREVPLEECGLYGKILAKKRSLPKGN